MSREPLTSMDVDALLPSRSLSPTEVDALVDAVQDGVRRRHSAHRRQGGLRVGSVALAAAVLVGVLTGLLPDPLSPDDTPLTSPVLAATPIEEATAAPADDRIQAAEGTRFALEGPHGDRVVKLGAGRVRCAVSKRAVGERFRVVVGGAEVEVTGTRFDVVAQGDVLSEVTVEEGEVLLRLETGETLHLEAGDHWTRPAPKAVVDPSTPTESEPPAVEVAFGEALARFDAADFAGAMQRFSSIQSGPLAADARFWAAVSRVRMGRDADALHVVEAALKAGVPAERQGTLHCLLAQLLTSHGRVEEAELHLQRTRDDPNPAVAACGSASGRR